MVYSNGDYKGSTFEGEFKEDLVNGYGILKLTNGASF